MSDVSGLVDTGRQYAKDGDPGRARQAFMDALRQDANSGPAHLGLARLNMPGQSYMDCLEQIHEFMVPARYLEIGVAGFPPARYAFVASDAIDAVNWRPIGLAA